MDFIKLGNLIAAFGITIFLMICHFLSPFIHRIKKINPRKVTSFAGGVAIAYVFLHMLPELVEGNETIGKLLSQTQTLTPLLDLGIFIIALFGFLVFFGLELMADRSEITHHSNQKIYYLHLFMYCIYNFIITYTMPLRVQTGMSYAILFSVTIGIHFILTDRNFNRHFKNYFTHTGRFTLLCALLLGWVITAVTDPINVLAVSFMIAFLSGSVLYSVFREELPTAQEPKFGSFICGIAVVTVILVWITITHH